MSFWFELARLDCDPSSRQVISRLRGWFRTFVHNFGRLGFQFFFDRHHGNAEYSIGLRAITCPGGVWTSNEISMGQEVIFQEPTSRRWSSTATVAHRIGRKYLLSKRSGSGRKGSVVAGEEKNRAGDLDGDCPASQERAGGARAGSEIRIHRRRTSTRGSSSSSVTAPMSSSATRLGEKEEVEEDRVPLRWLLQSPKV
eukprot:maker-scaffold685_size112133-snap-gene-0.16 protein:Tk02078 transcript:maker-scaffold685_size112133-snap-gene-0.16-mRNA-1 annotation:"phosphoribosylformylglycinamidine synthetase subunit"